MNRNLRTLVTMLALALAPPALAELEAVTAGPVADGAAFRDLSAAWWQWLISVPTPVNPILDETGEHCVVGQRGSTWFLAGTFGGAVTRSCAVPEGARLFFPVLNFAVFDSPGVCGQGPERIPIHEMRAFAGAAIDAGSGYSLEIDGRPAPGRLHRVRSRVFALAVPADNVFVPGCGTLPAGVYSPAVDDGVYVRLPPLSVGEHTVRFRAEVPEAGFVTDATYHLTVVPVLP
jgi:hypothetical protein